MSLTTKALLTLYHQLDPDKQKEFTTEVISHSPFELSNYYQTLIMQNRARFLINYTINLLRSLGFAGNI